MMTPAEAERFDRIARSIQFGATFKDLQFLVKLVEKLARQPGSAAPPNLILPKPTAAPPLPKRRRR